MFLSLFKTNKLDACYTFRVVWVPFIVCIRAANFPSPHSVASFDIHRANASLTPCAFPIHSTPPIPLYEKGTRSSEGGIDGNGCEGAKPEEVELVPHSKPFCHSKSPVQKLNSLQRCCRRWRWISRSRRSWSL